MALKTDMLSVTKVKLHGMKDPKWTTKDKITQYKGLINLYERDKQIVCANKGLSRKRDKKMVCHLKKLLTQSRFVLDNAIYGDRQTIRNVLSGDKSLQLACQDLQTHKIIEHISQNNFNYRKQLDLLYYRKKVKTDRLVSLKLQVSEFEDRLVHDLPGSLPVEVLCKILTACIQDRRLRIEESIVINETYKKIVFVCKKDCIYFDAILESLRTDHANQNHCMLNTIILGQVAMEYLDDRKSEYLQLERNIKMGMRQRKQDHDALQLKVDCGIKHLKVLVRRDSDITLPVTNANSNVDLQQEMDSVCQMMELLKTTFVVNEYFELFYCLQEQHRQKDRLEELKAKMSDGKNSLQNKINHANLMFDELYYTMNETTQEYMERKVDLKKKILDKTNQIKEFQRISEMKCGILTKIKESLQNLEQICKYVGQQTIAEKKVQLAHSEMTLQRKLMGENLDIKSSSFEIIDILCAKLQLLVMHAGVTDDRNRIEQSIMMENLVSNRTKSIIWDEKPIQCGFLVDEVMMDDPAVPTRADIKIMSSQIVASHAVNEDQIPVSDAKSKTKKKK